MADLEDFFAKRDKKKSSKKKLDTSDDVSKILERKTKQKKELETGKSNYLAEGRQSPGPGLPLGGDDEWLEAEEKKPDFSNLKIQELILTSDDEDDPSQEGKENEGGGEGGVWKKKAQSKSNEEEKEKVETENPEGKEKEPEESKEKSEDKPEGGEAVVEEGQGGKETEESTAEVKPESSAPEPKKYIPPSMRGQRSEASAPAAPRASSPIPFGSAASGAASTYVPPSRRGTGATGPTLAPMKVKKGAPTLEDEDSFPTLS